MSVALLLLGLLGLVLGTVLAVRGATSISKHLHLSEFVIGVAILSIGSDLPELTIAINAGIHTAESGNASDVVVGSALGSCLGQIGLVLGVVGLLSYLTLPRSIVLRHGAVMLGSLVILAMIGSDGTVTRAEGLSLLTVYAIYGVLLWTDRRSRSTTEEGGSLLPLSKAWLYVVVGLLLVVGSAELTVTSVTRVAMSFQVDDAIIALVVVGMGTSLPELSISIGAILKKRSRLSVGNLVGSNIFDTLVPIGAASAIAPVQFDRDILHFDLPFLSALSLVVLFFFVRTRGLQRFEAAIVLGLYSAYVLLRLARA